MLSQLLYKATYSKTSIASKADKTEDISNDNVYLATTSSLLNYPK